MTDTWLVRQYPYVLRNGAPTAEDYDFYVPYIWIDINTSAIYVLLDNTPHSAQWIIKQADRTINTGSGIIYIIETIETGEVITIQGEIVTIGGEDATMRGAS